MKRLIPLLLFIGCAPAYYQAWLAKMEQQQTTFVIAKDSSVVVWGRAAVWATRQKMPSATDLLITWHDYAGNTHSVSKLPAGDSIIITLDYSVIAGVTTQKTAERERKEAATFIQKGETIELYRDSHQ